MLGCAIWMSAPNVAAAEEPACEVCVPRRVLAQCAEDAEQVDDARMRMVTCQRALDARTGASAELMAQLDAMRRLQAAEAARHARVVAELERRPTWRTVALVGGASLLAGAAGVALWQVTRQSAPSRSAPIPLS